MKTQKVNSMKTQKELELEEALVQFKKATDAFAKCRCYSYMQFVKLTTDKLMRASDAVAWEKRQAHDGH